MKTKPSKQTQTSGVIVARRAILLAALALVTSVAGVTTSSGAGNQSSAGETNSTNPAKPAAAPVPAENPGHATKIGLSEGVQEIAKLQAGGVDAPVIRAFVDNSNTPFRLSADDIVYLHEHAVSPETITAMIQRGAELRAKALQQPPQYVNPNPIIVAPSATVNPPAVAAAYPVQTVYPTYDYWYDDYSYRYGRYPYWTPSVSFYYSWPYRSYSNYRPYAHYNYGAPRQGGFAHPGAGFRGPVSHPVNRGGGGGGRPPGRH